VFRRILVIAGGGAGVVEGGLEVGVVGGDQRRVEPVPACGQQD
jgi:hypothetical protein